MLMNLFLQGNPSGNVASDIKYPTLISTSSHCVLLKSNKGSTGEVDLTSEAHKKFIGYDIKSQKSNESPSDDDSGDLGHKKLDYILEDEIPGEGGYH